MVFRLNIFNDLLSAIEGLWHDLVEFANDVGYFFDFMLNSIGQILLMLVSSFNFLGVISSFMPGFLSIFFALYVTMLIVRVITQLL